MFWLCDTFIDKFMINERNHVRQMFIIEFERSGTVLGKSVGYIVLLPNEEN